MLSVKKKKSLNLGIGLIVGLIVGIVHGWLASGVVIKNYGISFGFEGWWVILSFVWVFLVTLFWIKGWDKEIMLVVVGGWMNLIDRLTFGYVRDYWQIGTIYNNLADWLISVGLILFLIKILWKKK